MSVFSNHQRVRQLGVTVINDTFPIHEIVLFPGGNVGKSPLIQLFMEVMPEYASCKTESIVISPFTSDSSAMVFLILGKKKALTIFPPTLDFLSVHSLHNNHIAYGTALHDGLSERIRSLWPIFLFRCWAAPGFLIFL